MKMILVKWCKWRAKRHNEIAKRHIAKAMELTRRAERALGDKAKRTKREVGESR